MRAGLTNYQITEIQEIMQFSPTTHTTTVFPKHIPSIRSYVHEAYSQRRPLSPFQT